MVDLSHMSDEELMAIAQGYNKAPALAVDTSQPYVDNIGVKNIDASNIAQVPGMAAAPSADYSHLSDEDLYKAAGIPVPGTPVTKETLQAKFDEKKMGILDRIGADYQKRLAEGQASADRYVAGEQGKLSTGLQFAGKIGAGTAADIGSEILNSAPQFVKDAAGNVINHIGNLPTFDGSTLNQGIPKLAAQIGGAYGNFAENHPVAASNIESVANIGALLPTGKILSSAAPVAADAAKASLPVVQATAQAGKNIASYPVTRALEKSVSNNLDDYGLELAKKARDIGIKIPIDSISKDGPIKTIGQLSQATPFSGIKAIDRENLNIWSKNVANTIGADKPINAKVLAEAKERFGQKFDQIEKGRDVPISNEFLDGLDEIKKVANEASTQDVKASILTQVKKIEDNILYSKDMGLYKPSIPVETLATLRKDVNKLSGQSSNYEISSALGDMEGFLSDKIIDSLPDVGRKEYGDLKKQYRSFIAIKKAVKLDPENALSSPSKLLNAVATVYKDFPTGGGGELGDLARIGKMFVSPRQQGSPTFEKFATAGALASIPASLANPIIPAIAATGVAAGRFGKNAVYNQRAVDAAIRKGLSKADLQAAFEKRKGAK